MRHTPLFVFLLFFSVAFGTLGCDSNSSEDGNEPPVIEEILVNPSTVEPSRGAELTAVATDPEGEELSYFWSSDGGKIETGLSSYSTTANPAQWESPDETGDYEIKCTVSDSESTASKTVTVEVRQSN